MRSSLWAARHRAARCDLPGTLRKTSSLPPSEDGFVPAWSCSRRGLPGHPHYYGCRWSLTPPFHHHPHPAPSPNTMYLGGGPGRGLFVSVALIRQVRSSRRFPAPGAIRRRALGSADFPRPRYAGPRSPNRPEETLSYTQGNIASTTTRLFQTIFLNKPAS